MMNKRWMIEENFDNPEYVQRLSLQRTFSVLKRLPLRRTVIREIPQRIDSKLFNLQGCHVVPLYKAMRHPPEESIIIMKH